MTRTGPVDADRVVRRRDSDREWVTREVVGETLIIPVADRVGNLDAIFTLNEVGGHIWHLLDRPVAVRDLVQAVCAEFDVEAAEATTDVVEFLERLEAKALVRMERSAPRVAS